MMSKGRIVEGMQRLKTPRENVLQFADKLVERKENNAGLLIVVLIDMRLSSTVGSEATKCSGHDMRATGLSVQ